MPALKSSANSPASNLWTAGALVVLASIAVFVWSGGKTLSFGDAEAHLNIARRLTDSRTPGPSQIGTVWLPLPHLLMAPFAAIDALWFNGLAGVLPSFCCFVFATWLLYRMAGAAAAVFALNFNMLYLATTPMTEPIMAAAVIGLLYATQQYRELPTLRALLIVAAVSNAASLTRYEGWFLIAFVALFILFKSGWKHALLFAALASLAPIAWLAHNQFYYGDPLAFYRGPYSAQAILDRQLARGMTQPGMGSWWQALRYYAYAVRDVIGAPILMAAGCGVALSLYRRRFWALTLLALPGVFYVLSIHSGGTPVFVKELEPFTPYNTRYALAMLPFVAVAVAAIDSKLWTGVCIALVILSSSMGSIVQQEATLGDRRIQYARAAETLREYRHSSGIIFRFGELAPILRAAHIPLREGLYQDNLPQWDEALANPQVFQREEWALAEQGDEVDQAVQRQGDAYKLVDTFPVKGKPAILIYRRSKR